MKFYKIKHKPTGLFYKPSRHRNKSNIGKNGKVYATKGSVKSVLTGIYRYGFYTPEAVKKDGRNPKSTLPEKNEFEIVEYKVTI